MSDKQDVGSQDESRSSTPSVIIRVSQFNLGAAAGVPHFEKDAKAPNLHIMGYDSTEIQEAEIHHTDELISWLERWPVVWLDVDGVEHEPTLNEIVKIFKIHKLAYEDIVHLRQRPKLDSYEDQLFLVCKMFSRADDVDGEQLSIILGTRFVITFQEKQDGDCFAPIRERIRKGGRVRSHGPDYLTYSILDSIIDYYFPLLEVQGDRLMDLEERVMSSPGPDFVHKIHKLKRDLLIFKRSAWPLRDVVHALIRDAPPALVKDEARLYLRDCYDHVVQIVDLIETYREISGGVMDIYLSQTSHEMNNVMRTLTVISTIFIPLTFIAGVYGMNFNTEVSGWNMPELNAKYGYFLTMCAMFMLAMGMLWLFWRKGWLGRHSQRARERRKAKEWERVSGG